MNRILLLLLLLTFGGVYRLSAQNVTAAEYFIDTDPGAGNGTPIAVMPGDTATGSFPLNVTGLTPGFHNVYIRGCDAAGQWGFVQRQSFFVSLPPTPPPPPAAESVAAAEYFVDTDPGVGNGTPIPVMPGDTATGSFPLNVTSLTPGFHNLYIRGRNGAGEWGFAHRQNFYVNPPPVPPGPPPSTNIVAAEFFIDTDPGVGNGTPVSIPVPGDTVNALNIPATVAQCLNPGTYRLYLRGRDAAGQWGFYTSTAVTIQDVEAEIAGVVHQPASNCSITDVENFQITVNNTGAVILPAGLFQVYIDVTGANTGTYGPFTNANPVPVGGQGLVTATGINLALAGTNTVTASFALCNDTPTGNSSSVEVVGVVNPYPTVDPVPDQTACAGTATAAVTFTGNTPGATYTWTNSNTAIGLGAGGTGNIPSFTALNGGAMPVVSLDTVQATFEGCWGPIKTFRFTVNPQTTASIGGNPSFCVGNSTLLTASGGGTYAWSTGATTAAISVNTAGLYTVTVTNAGNCSATASATAVQLLELALSVKVFLQGPYVAAAQLMHDSLRVQNLLPLTEPYTGLTGFTHAGGGGGEQTSPAALAVSGSNALVDWVFLELRSAANPALVLATRSALVQRDGDVVEVDGSSPVSFTLPADASYFPVVRHRNHLGVQLGDEVFYTECVVSQTDFRGLPPEGFYAFNGLNPAQRLAGGVYMLWAGNGRIDFQLKYNGSNNDRNAVLSVVGLSTPNAIVPGYKVEDYNLDGLVKYNGSANDRNVLLGNVGVATPSAILHDQTAR